MPKANSSKKKFIQKYLKDWEREEILKPWLKPVPNDPHHATCSHCNVSTTNYFTFTGPSVN